MNKIPALILLFTGLMSQAQKVSKPDAYAQSITATDLKKHLYIIASKEMEGRETATEGQRKAAAYIEKEFRRIGLQPGNDSIYLQFFNVFQDSLVGAAMEVNGQSFQLDKDFNVNIANNINATMRFSEVIVLSSTSSVDSLRNMNLGGKLVMIIDNVQPQGRNQSGAPSIFSVLQTKGIAGLLIVQNNFPRSLSAARKSGQSINEFKRAINAQQFVISENIARSILGAQYETSKANPSQIKTYNANVLLRTEKTSLTAQSSNVLGLLPGTDLKNEYLFITAHYDHLGKRDTVIYYGADDDGSGTVAVIEMAEAFAKAKKDGKGPRRSIVFMAVSGEEKGLWGSEFYGNYPVYPLSKTTADLNIDMIGRSDSSRKGDTLNYVYVVGDDKISSDLKMISEAQNKKYTKLELDYKFNDPKDVNRIYYRSDHYNFARHGVPIIFYYDGMLGADYHRPTDTPDKINYPLLAKRAQLVFYTAWEMANRNEMLKRDLDLPVLSR